MKQVLTDSALRGCRRSSSGSQTGVSKQSGALIPEGGSRQEIAAPPSGRFLRIQEHICRLND